MDGSGEQRPEKPITDPIMLRFRPIAPKPAAGDPASGAVTPESLARAFPRRKVKRKYVRVQKKNQCNGNNDSKHRSGSADAGASGSVKSWIGPGEDKAQETLQLFSAKTGDHDHRTLAEISAPPDPPVVESRVTVESFGDACAGGGHQHGSLELDTCPAFVTDYSARRVLWVNEAYARLVTGGEPGARVAVRLVVKEEPPQLVAAFDGRVRLEHTWRNERYSKLVPCDVWRMDNWGGFAWRLDVKAALSLGF